MVKLNTYHRIILAKNASLLKFFHALAAMLSMTAAQAAWQANTSQAVVFQGALAH